MYNYFIFYKFFCTYLSFGKKDPNISKLQGCVKIKLLFFQKTFPRCALSVELKAARDYVAARSHRSGLEDLAWAILNSNEFLLRH